ncbi:MAG: SPASM domain-containing protein [Thermodesulfovibrionales bacterium]|nr:SPASM domain-containing protein [Thermodesulfovibrionales bacterium]
MKESQFNIIIEDATTKKTILYNSLYGTLTLWKSSQFNLANRFLQEPNLPLTNIKMKTIKSQLLKGKYLIRANIDEFQILRTRKLHGINDPNRLDVVIMPTMNCNFACPYCYEFHQSGTQMSDQTARAVKLWLQKEVPHFKVILLNWFGGEPLLSYKLIISLGTFIKGLCIKHNVALLTNITTNGYLLNKSRIKELIQVGYHNFQVTVDGPAELHNRTRILQDGTGTFTRVFNNIVLLAQAHPKVKISVRVNFNQDNLHSIPELLKLFPSPIRSQLRVVFEPIFGENSISANDNIPSSEISISLTKYYSLAKKLGYDVTLGNIQPGKLVYCYAERNNQFIINYNGDVFKCSVSTFDPKNRIGSLSSDGKINIEKEQLSVWTEIDLFDQRCYSCKFLPLCMGGCRKARLEHGNTGSYCALIPANTSYALKTIAFGSFSELNRINIRKKCQTTNCSTSGINLNKTLKNLSS